MEGKFLKRPRGHCRWKRTPNRVFPQRSNHHLPSVERMAHKVLPFRKFPR